ncbi:hypothetical protein CAOG_008452 [Capsaspora owczarzaki ATCC 30864]|uniref:Uncharacterized protein n=1 Tax=Capsaspora owczarzaki (strain ATCC 30864) TaxID=595528 RepID=A0A0D2WI28_CAPO3|nr:hypothetical protein CAOG_008452 [Capsaspora owczarzaki ATCC 30864]
MQDMPRAAQTIKQLASAARPLATSAESSTRLVVPPEIAAEFPVRGPAFDDFIRRTPPDVLKAALAHAQAVLEAASRRKA